jgi:hypothetical protein
MSKANRFMILSSGNAQVMLFDVERLKNQVRRQALYRRWRQRGEDSLLARWARSADGGPPPALFKQHLVLEHGKRFGLPTLVETGTYLGDMVAAMAPHFDHVYSIELDEALHRRAVARLAHLKNVTLLRGDSGALLGRVLKQIAGPCLFWLDGHYSGGVTARGPDDTPIRRELEQLFSANRSRDVILIDDARCFDGQHGYPTLEEVVALLKRHLSGVVAVAEDVIRATPCWP